MRWWAMASMVVLSGFSPSGVRPVAPPSRARRDTPLYRLKTPSHQVAMVLSARACGLDAWAAERVAGLLSGHYHEVADSCWQARADVARALPSRHLWLPHLQLDELRTRLRCAKEVLWLWLAIDARTKMLPVLELGPRTHQMVDLEIHFLRQSLAPGCIPLFTSDGLKLSFSALTAHFRQWLVGRPRGRNVRQWQVAAGLLYGQVQKC